MCLFNTGPTKTEQEPATLAKKKKLGQICIRKWKDAIMYFLARFAASCIFLLSSHNNPSIKHLKHERSLVVEVLPPPKKKPFFFSWKTQLQRRFSATDMEMNPGRSSPLSSLHLTNILTPIKGRWPFQHL